MFEFYPPFLVYRELCSTKKFHHRPEIIDPLRKCRDRIDILDDIRCRDHMNAHPGEERQ